MELQPCVRAASFLEARWAEASGPLDEALIHAAWMRVRGGDGSLLARSFPQAEPPPPPLDGAWSPLGAPRPGEAAARKSQAIASADALFEHCPSLGVAAAPLQPAVQSKAQGPAAPLTHQPWEQQQRPQPSPPRQHPPRPTPAAAPARGRSWHDRQAAKQPNDRPADHDSAWRPRTASFVTATEAWELEDAKQHGGGRGADWDADEAHDAGEPSAPRAGPGANKRKFSVPRRNEDTMATGDPGKRPRNTARKAPQGSGGAATGRRPSTGPRHGVNGNATGNGGSGGGGSGAGPVGADEEELTGKLRGCDPKLVEQIRNDIMDSGQRVQFSDIAGLAHAKQCVKELVVWPMMRPELFTGLRALPKGLLLFGPPGTGKTLIGKAIACESKATFFSISASSLVSKWIGESEKLVRTLFAVAADMEPAVVFIDEVDSLLTQRSSEENEASRRLKTEFLVQLDGAATPNDRVLVVGATNRPHELDEAARRRFVKKLYIPLPGAVGRMEILRNLLAKNRHTVTPDHLEDIVARTDGMSGADMKNLCTEAAMGPMRDLGEALYRMDEASIPDISAVHFERALRTVRPSVAQTDLDLYLKWNAQFGSFEAKPDA